MDLTIQACTLQQAQELKELGLDQDECAFYWHRPVNSSFDFTSEKFELNSGDKGWGYECMPTTDIPGRIAAPSTAELGEMLGGIEDGWHTYYSQHHGAWQWETVKIGITTRVLDTDSAEYRTEAEARAAMLLYCLHNKKITIEYCNEVIKMNGDNYEEDQESKPFPEFPPPAPDHIQR